MNPTVSFLKCFLEFVHQHDLKTLSSLQTPRMVVIIQLNNLPSQIHVDSFKRTESQNKTDRKQKKECRNRKSAGNYRKRQEVRQQRENDVMKRETDIERHIDIKEVN